MGIFSRLFGGGGDTAVKEPAKQVAEEPKKVFDAPLGQDASKFRQIFRNPEHQKQFEKDGYIVVPFLEPDEVQALLDFKNGTKPDNRFNTNAEDASYHFTFLDTNIPYKKQVFNTVMGFFQPKIDKYMIDYKPLIVNFVLKDPGFGEVPVHQNWNFVDETKHRSFSVWVPLVDTNKENGTLEVIPGTHTQNFYYALRSPWIPWYFGKYPDFVIEEYHKPLDVKAGMAVIFDDSLIHYSTPNTSDQQRIVIQNIIIPAETEAVHYYVDPEKPDTVEVMTVDKEFYLDYDMRATPKGYISKYEERYIDRTLNQEQFEALMKKAGIEKVEVKNLKKK